MRSCLVLRSPLTKDHGLASELEKETFCDSCNYKALWFMITWDVRTLDMRMQLIVVITIAMSCAMCCCAMVWIHGDWGEQKQFKRGG